ncbi:MAG TPA: DUF1844 domain-containing protein [candidate division Zixibacteria bacterium]
MEQEKKISEDEALFVQLVLMFQAAAMQQLGKLINPLNGKTERNLEQAKFSIDILDMLKSKTEGNLSEEEKRLLEHVVYELQMNYLDELKNKEKQPEKDTPKDKPTSN